MRTHAKLIFAVSFVALLVGCGPARMREGKVIATKPQPASKVLDRSLYAKNAGGSLTEDGLQRILQTPIDLQFPARVGVVPLAEPFDPAKNASIRTRSAAARHLAKALLGNPQFSHVSDISTELPHVGGIEGLRVLAARYRVRYLLLYNERFEDATHANGWAWLYPTVIGMFLAPGVTVESHGMAQVDLLDVRTGTILFSIMEPMHVSSQQLMVGAARAHRNKQAHAAVNAAETLAKRVSLATGSLVAFAEEWGAGKRRVRTRILPPPIPTEPDPVPPARGASP